MASPNHAAAPRPLSRVPPSGVTLARRSLQDCALLWRFLEVEEWTAAQLARALPLSPSTTSRTVEKLVHRSLVQRRPLLSDRRVVILTLTEEGMAVTQDQHRRVRAYETGLGGNVSDDEMKALTPSPPRSWRSTMPLRNRGFPNTRPTQGECSLARGLIKPVGGSEAGRRAVCGHPVPRLSRPRGGRES